jgi:hypothetical protein
MTLSPPTPGAEKLTVLTLGKLSTSNNGRRHVSVVGRAARGRDLRKTRNLASYALRKRVQSRGNFCIMAADIPVPSLVPAI